MKKYKGRMIIGVLAVVLLILAFWIDGGSPVQRGKSAAEYTPMHTENQKPEKSDTDTETEPENEDADKIETEDQNENEESENFADSGNASNPSARDNGGNVSVPSATAPNASAPAEQQKKHYCTLSVRCDTILDNLDKLKPEKAELIPADGVILKQTEAEFFEGESVFNVLKREMKKNKIHMEFVNTPVYGSAYIEGIANIYEFDCGELSGWMYRVNGVFPRYGCSRYMLSDGDCIEWLYSCDLGVDLGEDFSADGGQRDE